eukprot:TRINITY_DN3745_c0_g2_i1.p1 TRINITY_DN3745_c0_g2~~TRINITY_DN3745_c0_g2_i1.p1  ORF type:complete len:865 (-),score=197.52 TRINITY_DN3745_c0_g2_i1:173-2767(-)
MSTPKASIEMSTQVLSQSPCEDCEVVSTGQVQVLGEEHSLDELTLVTSQMCTLSEPCEEAVQALIEKSLEVIIQKYSPEHQFMDFSRTESIWGDKAFVKFILSHVAENYDEEMFLELLNFSAACSGTEKQLVNTGVIGPLLSKMMDDEWNERSQVLGFKVIGVLSLDKEVQAYLGARGAPEILNNGLFRVQDDEDSVVACLKALTNFVYKCKSNKEIVASAKIGKTLLVCLESNPDSDIVHEWAANFLRSFGRVDTLPTPYRRKFLEILLARNFDSIFVPARNQNKRGASSSLSPHSSFPNTLSLSSPSPSPTPAIVASPSAPTFSLRNLPRVTPSSSSSPITLCSLSPRLHSASNSPVSTPSSPSSPPRLSPYLSASPSSSSPLSSSPLSPPHRSCPSLVTSTMWAVVQLVANKKEAKDLFVELDGLSFVFSSFSYFGQEAKLALPTFTLLSLLVKYVSLRTKIRDYFSDETVVSMVLNVTTTFLHDTNVLRAWAKFMFRLSGDPEVRKHIGPSIARVIVPCWKEHRCVKPLQKIFLLLSLQLVKSREALISLKNNLVLFGEPQKPIRTNLSLKTPKVLSKSHPEPARSTRSSRRKSESKSSLKLAHKTLLVAVEAILEREVGGEEKREKKERREAEKRRQESGQEREKKTEDSIKKEQQDKERWARLTAEDELFLKLADQLRTLLLKDVSSGEANGSPSKKKRRSLEGIGVDERLFDEDKAFIMSPRSRQDMLRKIRTTRTRAMKEEMDKLALKLPSQKVTTTPRKDKLSQRKSVTDLRLPNLERLPKQAFYSVHHFKYHEEGEGKEDEHRDTIISRRRSPLKLSTGSARSRNSDRSKRSPEKPDSENNNSTPRKPVPFITM